MGATHAVWDQTVTSLRVRQRRGLPWCRDDTRDHIYADREARAKEGAPDESALEARHAALAELHALLTHVDVQVRLQEGRLKDGLAAVLRKTPPPGKGTKAM